MTTRITQVPVIPAKEIPVNIDTLPPSKKRRSESPHVREPKNKHKKGKLFKASLKLEPVTPTSKVLPENDGVEEDFDDADGITHKRKSILRPSGGKSAKKAKTTATSQRSLPSLDEDGRTTDENWEEAAKPLNESPITTIKNGEHLELITNPPSERGDNESQPQSYPPRYLPRKYLELSVSKYEIPSTQPQGPGGLWTCTFEGCHARVHQATTDAGQAGIKEHLKTHITDTKNKIDLVLDEAKPYLPVQ